MARTAKQTKSADEWADEIAAAAAELRRVCKQAEQSKAWVAGYEDFEAFRAEAFNRPAPTLQVVRMAAPARTRGDVPTFFKAPKAK